MKKSGTLPSTPRISVNDPTVDADIGCGVYQRLCGTMAVPYPRRDPAMTTRRFLPRLPSAPGKAYRRARAARTARLQDRFSPRLRADPSAPALVLSPHPDDAVLDCWSLLAGDRDVIVVNLFTGLPPPRPGGG